MDIEALRYEHEYEWRRLEELSNKRLLNGNEADELVRLYQDVSTQLATIQATAPDPFVTSRLSQLLAMTRGRLTTANVSLASHVRTMFEVRLPAALYRIRWWIAGFTALFIGIVVLTAIRIVNDPILLDSFMSQEEQLAYVNEAFASYYDPGVTFTAMVWTNNAWIAVLCVSLGISGVVPVYITVSNAANLGAVAGLMAVHGEMGLFLKLITPHGLLELSAIFVAAAAGFKLFWTVIDPGGRPRTMALAQEGRALFTVALGLVIALALSGLVEGFVTGSQLLWWVKILIGATVWLACVWYAFVYGRKVSRRGYTGDLDELIIGATRPIAA